MRLTAPLAFLAFAAVACGGEDVDPADQPTEQPAASEVTPVEENPGLPTEAVEFGPTPWSQGLGTQRIGGRMWVSTASTVEQEGFSIVTQLRGLPTAHAYSWAVHRGDCTARDDRVLGLGYGTVATANDRGAEVANGGGPLGEMRLTFAPQEDGTAEETVFVPLDQELTRAQLESGLYSVRLHPNVEGEDPGPSMACAPVPPLPEAGE